MVTASMLMRPGCSAVHCQRHAPVGSHRPPLRGGNRPASTQPCFRLSQQFRSRSLRPAALRPLELSPQQNQPRRAARRSVVTQAAVSTASSATFSSDSPQKPPGGKALPLGQATKKQKGLLGSWRAWCAPTVPTCEVLRPCTASCRLMLHLYDGKHSKLSHGIGAFPTHLLECRALYGLCGAGPSSSRGSVSNCYSFLPKSLKRNKRAGGTWAMPRRTRRRGARSPPG